MLRAKCAHLVVVDADSVRVASASMSVVVREDRDGGERVESAGSCRQYPDLGAEGLARLRVERCKQVRLRRLKAVIEGGEEFGAELGGDDSASSPVCRIGAALDQLRRFEVIEEVGHHRSVDSEVLGQGKLATDSALSRCRKDLVPARAARKVGRRGVRGRGVRAQDHAQAPSEVACQRAGAAGGPPNIVKAARDVIHPLIIGLKARLGRSS